MHRTTLTLMAAALAAGTSAYASDGDFYFRYKPTAIGEPTAGFAAISPPIVTVEVGRPSSPLSATGGKAPITWAGSGWPAPLSLSADGSLSASESGAWQGLVAVATDAAGRSATVSFDLRVTAPLAASGSTAKVAAGRTASPFAATGGTPPYAWAASDLPGGVTLSADGRLSVAAGTAAGSLGAFVATVTDADGATADLPFSLTVSPPEGNLFAFGRNGYGQVLPGGAAKEGSPVSVNAWTDWSQVTGTVEGTCGLRGGLLYCWGLNSSGELGIPNAPTVRSGPTYVAGSSWWEVTGGKFFSHSCGTQAGKLYCWGNGAYGQLGNRASRSTTAPVLVDSGSTYWSSLATGGTHTCATKGGKLYCWGSHYQGQAGTGGTTAYETFNYPREVDGGSTYWGSVAATSDSTCATKNGTLFCFGDNSRGQLGTGGTVGSKVPKRADWTDGYWTGLVGGSGHFCGIKGGKAYCWGANSSGQVGNGTRTDATSGPVELPGTGWTRLAAGNNHTCGIRAKKLLCWGSNADGQLGVPGIERSEVPIEVGDPSVSWSSVSAGAHHTLAIRE